VFFGDRLREVFRSKERVVIRLTILIAFLSLELSALTLKVNIRGIDNSKSGDVIVNLFERGSEFPDGDPLESFKAKTSKSDGYALFKVQKGQYAVAVIHDHNSNGKEDSGFLGFGGEGYGYSNNYKFFPSFIKSQLNVNRDLAIQVKMNY
jgi:uncharacterized protein (DUF2141 family)